MIFGGEISSIPSAMPVTFILPFMALLYRSALRLARGIYHLLWWEYSKARRKKNSLNCLAVGVKQELP